MMQFLYKLQNPNQSQIGNNQIGAERIVWFR